MSPSEHVFASRPTTEAIDKMRSRGVSAGSIRPRHRYVIALYGLSCVAVVVQRGILGPQHNVFKIFRQSFWHLLAGQNLYARYPLAQGSGAADLFKYSPTAALFFAPFALPPYSIALFGWSLIGALLLYRALTSVLAPERAVLAALLVFPDLLVSLQACSSNAQVAALIILAFAALERRRQLRSAIAIVAGAAIKIFPLAALTFAIFHPGRRRFALIVAGVLLMALALPLVVTSPAHLAQQYRWWAAIERSDAADLAFGLSAMHLLRLRVAGGNWPNWPLQIAGTIAMLLPLAFRRDRWSETEFRVGFLSSLLAYCVLFNHQAERPSFVIASAGVAIWCVAPPTGTTAHRLRALLGLTALVGLRTPPLLVVWLVMQAELYGWRFRWPATRQVAGGMDHTGVVKGERHTAAAFVRSITPRSVGS